MTLKQFKKIADKISPANHVVAIQSGFNLIVDGKTYSFYYPKKGHNKIVHKTKVIPFRDKEEFGAFRLLRQKLEDPSIVLEEKVAFKTPVPPEPTNNAKFTLSTKGVLALYGTEACIAHIQAKIEKMQADTTRNNSRFISGLKNLIDELKQYL